MNKQSRSMRHFEEGGHSFVIRIWFEHSTLAQGDKEYRGWIDHLPSGERRYFHQLAEIDHFIRNWLEFPSSWSLE